MKTKTITMYELMGLIKDNKAPKKIRWNYNDLNNSNDNKIYIWYDWAQGYYEDGHSGEYKCKLLAHRNEQYSGILNSTVEILEENEWEDIEELDTEYSYSYESINITLNKIIKNQKYLKERLDKDEN